MQILLYGCHQLAPRLTERGYQVVQDSRKAEAMLYTGKVIPNLPVSEQGAFLVNVADRSVEEVDRILQSRLYSNLFESKKYF